MAGEITGVTPKVPNTIDQTADFAKGLGLSEKATQTVKDVAAILGGRNVSVNTNARVENGEPGAGLFVRKLLEIVPDIPIIDETAWRTPERRAAFLGQAGEWRFRQ